jgi:hypothetical protein
VAEGHWGCRTLTLIEQLALWHGGWLVAGKPSHLQDPNPAPPKAVTKATHPDCPYRILLHNGDEG